MSAGTLPSLRVLTWNLMAASVLALTSCQMSELTHTACCDDHCPGHARVCEKPTVRALAHDLDALEAHIERYGSVSIQAPSVWGQARLTKHRQDFENQMALELPNFAATLNGSISRTDQAYFINALSLSAAASGGGGSSKGSSSSASSSSSSTSPLDTSTADVTAGISGMTRNPATMPALVGFGGLAKNGISLEPTTFLRQKANYLNCLNELRRINEGDDTADSPGYALNLVRIPVSVLPGKQTERGYGAEVTMTLKPYLSDELLPTTFRNLVVNDLLDLIGVPLTQFLNDPVQVEYFQTLDKVWNIELDNHHNNWRQVLRLNYSQLSTKSQDLLKKSKLVQQMFPGQNLTNKDYNSIREVFKNSPFIVSSSKMRHSKRPFPPSQMLDVFGVDETDNVVMAAIKQFKYVDPANKYWTHFPDVQAFLQEEIQGAYRFLADPTNGPLWTFCSPDLVTAIHTRKVDLIKKLRDTYADQVLATTKRDITEDVTVALAWAIIVDSALLTDQLKQDMKEAFAAKDCNCPVADWEDYYLPAPSSKARDAFNRYVECRWPIMVFALDPVADQQNLADTFSQRREMQLAMSLAFVNGNVSAKNLTRYARRLESQMEAVLLNNTVAGFSHGNETFGWRFYPRFQTPEIESNGMVFMRDLMLGDQRKDTQLKQRKLEPGQRECTAVVVMPSFVPYCTLDVSSSWFKLTNPKSKDMTCVDAIKLSARVKAIENCADRVMDADCYRDGELERLKKKAKQLEARLPLQDMKVPIPYENTLGGFAMFNTGITDLTPELYGWYGAPGINTNDTTTLFLIGNHFNVMSTRVVVGGINIDPTSTELLSRQVMRITIPKGALMIDRETGNFPVDPAKAAAAKADPAKDAAAQTAALNAKFGIPQPADAAAATAAPPAKAQELFVDVHLATPYGVTSHLLIPALGAASTAATTTTTANSPTANWTPNGIWVGFVAKGLGIAASNPPTVRPSDLTIQLATPASGVNSADLVLTIGGGATAVSYDFALPGVAVAKNQTIAFTAAQRDALVAAIFDKIGPQYTKDIAPNAGATVKIKSIALKQDTTTLSTLTPAVSSTLAVTFMPAALEKETKAK